MSLSPKPLPIYVFLFYSEAHIVYFIPHCVLDFPYGSAMDIASFLREKDHSLLSLQFLVGFHHANRELQSLLMTSILVLWTCNMVQHFIFYLVCVTMKMSGAVFTVFTALGIQCSVNPCINIFDQLGEFAPTIALSIYSPFPGHLLNYLQYFFYMKHTYYTDSALFSLMFLNHFFHYLPSPLSICYHVDFSFQAMESLIPDILFYLFKTISSFSWSSMSFIRWSI